jgi:hypothetical protein
MIRPLIVIVLVAVAISCKKSESTDDGIKPEDKEKAAALQTFLQSDKFRLKKYYSETPIDYIDTDQVVKSETDLWQYVSGWLHDDAYVFGSNGTVTVEQNAMKIPGDSTPTLSRSYAVKADKNGVGFDFIGHEYQDLKYRLITFNDTMLKVSASWNNKTVISEYNTLP